MSDHRNGDEGPIPGRQASEGLSESEWAARRARLASRLDAASARHAPPPPEKAGRGGLAGMAAGLKIASEFIAGVVVGALLGYGVDTLFGTRPFGLIILLMFGFAAGVMNVIRATAKGGTGGGSSQEDDPK